MYRIRLHGRGGHGMKTAGRILGTAFFGEGFDVQDAPRYGAERRGAPLFASVRADRRPIHERGLIGRPDLVVVADDTLVTVAAAGALGGVDAHTVLLIASAEDAETWRRRLSLPGPVLVLPAEARESAELRFLGATCAGAAARLVGVIGRGRFAEALREELAELDPSLLEESLARALAAYDRFEPQAGCVVERDAAEGTGERPDWIRLPFDPARISAPEVRAAGNSVEVRTGLWRTLRPVIDPERCHRCSWVCSTLCPDGAIQVGADAAPSIDYDHCKGCLVCIAVCPHHAIDSVLERDARDAEEAAP